MENIKQIIDHYLESKSIWKTGKQFGIAGQTVHKILVKNNIKRTRPRWTSEENKEVTKLYTEGFIAGDGQLEALAKKLNRTTSFVGRKAKNMGLTKIGRNLSIVLKNNISQKAKRRIKEKGHPKGMLGKKHTEEMKVFCSEKSKRMWKDKNSAFNTKKFRDNISDRSFTQMMQRIKENPESLHSRGKSGWIEIGNKKIYVRSSWEANIASYLEYLKINNQILNWEYESKTFIFPGIHRDNRSYTPDFEITLNDNCKHLIEVKGWMDKKSYQKRKLMEEYYPHVKVQTIGKKDYDKILKMKSQIPNWGLLD